MTAQGMRTDCEGGVVYLVGAGPGDPGLITVRGLECIRRADVILYDSLANPQLLESARPDCEKRHVGGLVAEERPAQEAVNELMIRRARENKMVVRLKGGDPFVFARGGEEAEALARAGVPFRVVPGVTSGLGALTYAGIPATLRGTATSATLITGHRNALAEEELSTWVRLGNHGGTLIYYMAVRKLGPIVNGLLAHGLDPHIPAALVEWATYARQRTVTAELGELLAAAERERVQSPAILVIGRVVSLRERINWFEAQPCSVCAS